MISAQQMNQTEEDRCQRLLREVQERLQQKTQRDVMLEEQKIASAQFDAKVKQIQA